MENTMYSQSKQSLKQLSYILFTSVSLLAQAQASISYGLTEENQREVINAHQLPYFINGRDVKVGIIDSSNTENHSNHVTSSARNIAPRTNFCLFDLNNDPILSQAGQGNARLIAALDKAIEEKCNFINISLRIAPGNISADQAWNEAITSQVKAAFLRVRDAGIGIIKSAGNDQEFIGSTAYTLSLVNLLKEMNGFMILTAASEYNSDNQFEKLAGFSKAGSNFAGLAHEYTITVPGKHNYARGANNIRMPMSGTSMAAPIATGAACLIMSAHPELSSREVFRYLLASARTKTLKDNIDLPTGKYGRGILDVGQALTMIKN